MATKHTDACHQKAKDDEPLFTLLARDALAPERVREWAREAEKAGKPLARVLDAFQTARDMEAWRAVHPDV